MEYTAYAFYINTERNTWKMHFNVTKKLNAFIQVSLYAFNLLYCLQAKFNLQQIKEEHDAYDEATHFQFQFEIGSDRISLELDKKYTKEGWSIRAAVYPCKVFHMFELFVEVLTAVFPHAIAQLLKKVVDNWNNATPACCHVDVLAVDGPDTAPFLSYYAPVTGIIPKDISFHISRRLQSVGQCNHEGLFIL